MQNYGSKLSIVFKIVHYCCFCSGGTVDFLQKMFYNLHDWEIVFQYDYLVGVGRPTSFW